MNIYENFIESTGSKKVELNTKSVLEGYKKQLNQIQSIVINFYNQINEEENKLRTNNYSVDFIKEYKEKMLESINSSIDSMFNKRLNSMEEDLRFLKERAMLSSGDKDISRNNIMKLQTVLPTLSDEDKEQLFESNKDKDPKILEILYINTKNSNASLAARIMEYLDEFTGEKEIKIVENQLEQIKGLKSYLGYDYIKGLDATYHSETLYSTEKSGAVNRVIGAFIEDIDKQISIIENK